MAILTCKNCGAAIEPENQFVRTVTCEFCGSSYILSGSETLNPVGSPANIADYPSRLKVGMRGKIKGRGFKVMGRVRYTYDAGYWEEWQIVWDDGAPSDWLEEDEGLWVLYKRERIKSAIPSYDSVSVGSVVKINTYDLFVTEKRRAKVLGYRGQFTSVLPLTGDFGYIEGSAGDEILGINYWQDEIELSVGEELEFSDVVIDETV